MTAEPDAPLLGLIQLLYESALDERLWSNMAGNLAQVFGASSASIKIYHPDQANADILQLTDNFAVAEANPEWAEHWHRNDLWVQEATRRQLTGVGTSGLLMPDAELIRTAYYNEWLRPLAIHCMVGGLVPLGPDAPGSISIGIHRPHGTAQFGQHDEQKLAVLIPHLQLALGLRRHVHSTQVRMQALDQALDTASLAILAVDHKGRLLFANKPTEALLHEEGPLVVKAGRLHARPARDDAELQHKIQVSQRTPGAAPVSMKLGQSGPKPLVLTFVPLTTKAHELNASGPATLVLIRGLEAPKDKGAETLKQLYGLTPMEGRVAIALAQGHSPDDIAALFGIGLGTVRTHLKSAMAKTGTNRQPQLVAMVWHSVGPLRLHR